MLHESAHITVTANRGVATVWLAFPGEPVNALNAARLRELDAAITALQGNPFLEQVVIRSAKPAGFCAGLHPNAVRSLTHPSDRAAFSRFGQSVLARLASLRQTTIAFIEGPCLGAGLELALACDYRLCVASLTNHLGFPFEPPCFGGLSLAANSRNTMSGREARSLGLVDRAFCERRAKLELQMFLNEAHRKPLRTEPAELADVTRAFAMDMGRAWQPLTELEPEIALARGFITPLEFEQLPRVEEVAGREHASGRRAA